MEKLWRIYIVALVVTIGVFFGNIASAQEQAAKIEGWIGLETLVDKEGNPVWSPAYYVHPGLFRIPMDQVGRWIVPLPPVSVNCELRTEKGSEGIAAYVKIQEPEKPGERRRLVVPNIPYSQPPERMFSEVVRMFFKHLDVLSARFKQLINEEESKRRGGEPEIVAALRQKLTELEKYREELGGRPEDHVLVLAKRRISESRVLLETWEFYSMRKDKLAELSGGK
jgi:hypothetical protein